MTRNKRRIGWFLVGGVMITSLFVAGLVEGPPRTNEDRVRSLSTEFACPTCDGQSVAESDAVVAQEIRREIRRLVDEGQTDETITETLIAGFDESIDLRPRANGVVGLVWLLPIFAAVFATAGVGRAVQRWTAEAQLETGASSGASSAPAPAAAVQVPSVSPWKSRLRWIGGSALLASAAAFAMLSFAGARGANETATGEIRESTATLIARAATSFREGDVEGAIELYDEALDIQPTNVEALTYRGWVRFQTGDIAAASADFDEAVAFDEGYSDVRVFRTVAALDRGDAEAAAAELSAFDASDPAPFAEQLVIERQLREQVAIAQLSDAMGSPDTIDIDSLGVDPAQAQAAGEAFVSLGQPTEALRSFDAVLLNDPANALALAWRGWTLALTAESGASELWPEAQRWLDEAIAADPNEPHSLVFRAFVNNRLERFDDARIDLEVFDQLANQPPSLLALIDDFGLREALEVS